MALSRKQFLGVNTVNTTALAVAAAPKQFLSAAASAMPTCFPQLPAVPLIPTNCANPGTFNFNFNFGQTPKNTEASSPVVMTAAGSDLVSPKTSPRTSTPGTTTEKPFKCNMCGQQFARRDTLQCHQRTHTGERPYPCDTCPLRFARRDTLQCHRRTHTGERRFACDICLQRFARRDTLRCHRRTHSGDKPFACDLCIQRFARRDTLQCHRRTHSGEKPFVCQYCNKRFARTDKLQRHRRTHLRGANNINVVSNSSNSSANCNGCVQSPDASLNDNRAPSEGNANNQNSQQGSSSGNNTVTTNNNNTSVTTSNNNNNIVSPVSPSTTINQTNHTTTHSVPCSSQHLHSTSNVTMVTPHHHSPHPPQMPPTSSVVSMSSMYPQTTAGFIPPSLPKTDRFPANMTNQLWQIFY